MPEHKGKPSGKFAGDKSSPGRKGNYQRTGWPEDGPLDKEEKSSPPVAEGPNRHNGNPGANG